MKITILADLYEGDTYDPAVDQVAEALRQGGHKVSQLLVPDDIKAITTGLARRKPDLVFHMIHDFGGESGLIATAGVVDAMKIPYTGGGPGELFIRGNKILAKKILAYEKLTTPTTSSSPRTPASRPAATCACRSSSSRSSATARSGSGPRRWSARCPR